MHSNSFSSSSQYPAYTSTRPHIPHIWFFGVQDFTQRLALDGLSRIGTYPAFGYGWAWTGTGIDLSWITHHTQRGVWADSWPSMSLSMVSQRIVRCHAVYFL